MGTEKRDVTFRDLLGRLLTYSHQSWELTLRPVPVDILEMEDVLFHHNSAVLMPENPKGKSSQDGSPASGGQENITGIKALALVFQHFQFYPDKKMIIAGHADTSGQPDYNFKLSKMRAESVLSLLAGDADQWAGLCYDKQKIEDYQQILAYFADNTPYQWPCHPGDPNDSWNAATKEAIKNFVNSYNTEFAAKQAPPLAALSAGLAETVEKDGQKRWTKDLWKAVYQLYTAEIARVFLEARSDIENRRKILRDDPNKWIDAKRKAIGCGESFPIEQKEKPNYRSQKNRRVEILFFKGQDAPLIDCPADIRSVHKPEVCPLYHPLHIKPHYIDPLDLYAVVYHLSIQFFSRVDNAMTAVPAGLKIQAFENGSEELSTSSTFQNGVYYVKVQFKTRLDDSTHKSLHFEFKTNQTWVHTESKGGTPQLVPKTDEDIRKLSWKDRQKFYDLPAHWSSRNYWTRYDGDLKKGERFEKVLKEIKTLKPFGSGVTSPGQPLTFSLDDIVLMAVDGNQNINDPSGNKPQDLDDQDNHIDLSADSKISLFVLREDKDYQLEVLKPLVDRHPYFSGIDFSKNLITEIPEEAKIPRLVIFCGKFFGLMGKRTFSAASVKFDQGHVLGARAAIFLNDPAVNPAIHAFAKISADPATGVVPADAKDYAQSWCGNYELHYLGDCGVAKSHLDGGEKALSYLMIYWTCRHRMHTDTLAGRSPADVIAAGDLPADWREKFEKEGLPNSMNRTNRPYLLEKKSGPKDILIRPYHFFEAKLDGRGGKHKAMVEISKVDEAWMQPELAKFGIKGYTDEAGRYEAPEDGAKDVDGQSYKALTNHHEMGHATGHFDDYLYDLDIRKKSDLSVVLHTYSGITGFSQPYTAPGGPYFIDILARMKHNRVPRMRDYWNFVSWVNDESGETTNKKLKPFLDGTAFKLTYKFNQAGSDKVIELDLGKPQYRNICRPSYESLNYGFDAGSTGRSDLLLYRLGGGETAHTFDPKHLDDPAHAMNPRHVFDGILVVRTKIALKFIDDTNNWDVNRISNWVKEWIEKRALGLNGYYWEDAQASDFKKTIMIFVPYFMIYAAPVPTPVADWAPAGPPADSHFDIEVKYNDGTGFASSGKTLRVDSNVDSGRLFRYFFGKTAAVDIGKTDFGSVKGWLDGTTGTAGSSFTIKDLP